MVQITQVFDGRFTPSNSVERLVFGGKGTSTIQYAGNENVLCFFPFLECRGAVAVSKKIKQSRESPRQVHGVSDDVGGGGHMGGGFRES